MTAAPRIVSMIGTRPNFVKMAPVIGQLNRYLPPGHNVIVHTGQHYDRMLSDVFLEQLDVPRPNYLLHVGSGTHAIQTARLMKRLEPVLLKERPDLLIVPGDVNSTLAAALVAAKLGIPIAHVEAGLRSFDRAMPEEINRLLTDQLSELLFVHCQDAIDNLRAEGIAIGRIHFVGNTMIDTLRATEERFRTLGVARRLRLRPREYVLVTLHRPALVDGPLLEPVLRRLAELSRTLPVLLPAHPRTRARINQLDVPSTVRVTGPVGYLEFLSLQSDATAVLTDSGGVQEETTCLGVPCFTLRSSTERPVTISLGTNTLLGLNPERIAELPALLAHRSVPDATPPLWDGRAAERLAPIVIRWAAAAAAAPPLGRTYEGQLVPAAC